MRKTCCWSHPRHSLEVQSFSRGCGLARGRPRGLFFEALHKPCCLARWFQGRGLPSLWVTLTWRLGWYPLSGRTSRFSVRPHTLHVIARSVCSGTLEETRCMGSRTARPCWRRRNYRCLCRIYFVPRMYLDSAMLVSARSTCHARVCHDHRDVLRPNPPASVYVPASVLSVSPRRCSRCPSLAYFPRPRALDTHGARLVLLPSAGQCGRSFLLCRRLAASY